MVFKYLMLDVALELMVVSESTVVVDKTKCMSSHSILEMFIWIVPILQGADLQNIL